MGVSCWGVSCCCCLVGAVPFVLRSQPQFSTACLHLQLVCVCGTCLLAAAPTGLLLGVMCSITSPLHTTLTAAAAANHCCCCCCRAALAFWWEGVQRQVGAMWWMGVGCDRGERLTASSSMQGRVGAVWQTWEGGG